MAKCTHEDCFTCPYDDCIENGIRESDKKEIRERNKRVREGDGTTNIPFARRKNKRKLY